MRIEGWENRLNVYFESVANTDFQYGACDCVVFASDAVMSQVNIDPMLEGRGKYTNLKEGVKLISELRGSYEGIMDHYFPRLPTVRRAQRGDVVLTQIDGDPCYGIVWHSGFSLFKSKGKGLTPIKTLNCAMAWRIA